MEFFTSELNLNQSNILQYENRPYNDVDEMNNVFIENINKKVGKEDKLFILGNFIFGSIEEDKFIRSVKYFTNKINSKNLFLLFGNRDRRMKKNSRFLEFFRYTASDMELKTECGRSVILGYWPLWIWNRKESIHLYGLNTPQYKTNAYCVSVDAAKRRLGSYEPFTLNELLGEK